MSAGVCVMFVVGKYLLLDPVVDAFARMVNKLRQDKFHVLIYAIHGSTNLMGGNQGQKKKNSPPVSLHRIRDDPFVREFGSLRHEVWEATLKSVVENDGQPHNDVFVVNMDSFARERSYFADPVHVAAQCALELGTALLQVGNSARARDRHSASSVIVKSETTRCVADRVRQICDPSSTSLLYHVVVTDPACDYMNSAVPLRIPEELGPNTVVWLAREPTCRASLDKLVHQVDNDEKESLHLLPVRLPDAALVEFYERAIHLSHGGLKNMALELFGLGD